MKIVERILLNVVVICLLYLATLAGAYAVGFINGKLDCPTPKTEQTASLHSSYQEAITKLTAFSNDNIS